MNFLVVVFFPLFRRRAIRANDAPVTFPAVVVYCLTCASLSCLLEWLIWAFDKPWGFLVERRHTAIAPRARAASASVRGG